MQAVHKLVNYNLRPTQEHGTFYLCDHFSQTEKITGIGIYQHRLWQATTCKEHVIIYEHTKKEDNFLNFATTIPRSAVVEPDRDRDRATAGGKNRGKNV